MEAKEAFDEIRAAFDANAADPKSFYPGDWGATIGILTRACGSNENRQQFQKKLTGSAHSRMMTEGEKWALICFVQPFKGASGWQSDRGADLIRDVGIVLSQCVDESQQDRLF